MAGSVPSVLIRPLAVDGAFEITPRHFDDSRGTFLEWFKIPSLAAVLGHGFNLHQANCSVSAAGVIRGMHFTDVPPGQAKYVTCVTGAVLDVTVDVRMGSPTFASWDSVLLDGVDRRAVYLAEGLGHAFLSLQDHSTVVYLCSTGYAPEHEHAVHPLDPALAIDWPSTAQDGTPLSLQLSDKDAVAPTLDQARLTGLLPDAAACIARREVMRTDYALQQRITAQGKP
jgi:dTDP-4-dehydrorhamnose 3,5-epimerase